MNSGKLLAALVLAAGCISQPARAEVISYTNNLPIPDGLPAGISEVVNVSSSISQLAFLQVSLNISGNFNGDLYCYLQHNGSLSVLLNRAGRSATNAFGYADAGFVVTFMDLAPNGNIHTYGDTFTPTAGSPLTGVWAPDGRTNSPANVLNTDPVTAGLSQFTGLDPNGSWTLFIADLSPGGSSVLNSWQLSFGVVPEPSVTALGILGVGVAAVWRRKGNRENP